MVLTMHVKLIHSALRNRHSWHYGCTQETSLGRGKRTDGLLRASGGGREPGAEGLGPPSRLPHGSPPQLRGGDRGGVVVGGTGKPAPGRSSQT